MKMLVYSRIRNLDSEGVSLRGKSCAARPWEKWRHAVSNFRRAVSMKISTENRKWGKTVEEIERQNKVTNRRRVYKTKSF